MNSPREDLLQPTLATDAPTAAPFTVQATFFTGFFGGPFAALALIGWNSHRLRRLKRDLPMLVASSLAIVVAAWFLYGTAEAEPLRAWLQGTIGNSSGRMVTRLAALLLVGVGYLMHRSEQRSADLLGLTRPNGWLGGAICSVIGIALLMVMMMFAGSNV